MRYAFTQYCPRFGFKQKLVRLSNQFGFNMSLYIGIYTLKLHRCSAFNLFMFVPFFLTVRLSDSYSVKTITCNFSFLTTNLLGEKFS
jgi:hypothetical protein